MKQLTMAEIMKLTVELQKKGMTISEIAALPIYIGDDDELNGIHTAWYGELIDANNENDKAFIEMINEDHHNIQLKGKAILIS